MKTTTKKSQGFNDKVAICEDSLEGFGARWTSFSAVASIDSDGLDTVGIEIESL